ncbi:MAG: hypothetical protein BRC31_08775, partial [Actinobacteria bacterium QS_5_72_10]
RQFIQAFRQFAHWNERAAQISNLVLGGAAHVQQKRGLARVTLLLEALYRDSGNAVVVNAILIV